MHHPNGPGPILVPQPQPLDGFSAREKKARAPRAFPGGAAMEGITGSALPNPFPLARSLPVRKHIRVRPNLEALEERVVPSTLPPPDPIVPRHGEANLLRVVQMHAD